VKAEDIANEIVNNPSLLEKIVAQVYEKLREDIIVQRIDKLEDAIKNLIKTVQENSEQIKKIWEKLEEMNKTLQGHEKRLEEMNKTLLEHTNILEEHTKALGELKSEVGILNKKVENLEIKVNDLDNKVNAIDKKVTNLENDVTELKKETKSNGEKIDTVSTQIERLSISLNAFTSRSGHYIERAMMNLYKKALELHGVDPDKVKHGFIVDEKGVTRHKGEKYEVDFYEVNDGEIYLFEVKNFGDEGAMDQLEDRKAIFESMGKKVIKMFLVCNAIRKNDLERAEKRGIIVITGQVTED